MSLGWWMIVVLAMILITDIRLGHFPAWIVTVAQVPLTLALWFAGVLR